MSSKTNSEVSKELYEKMSKLYLLITQIHHICQSCQEYG